MLWAISCAFTHDTDFLILASFHKVNYKSRFFFFVKTKLKLNDDDQFTPKGKTKGKI